MILTSTKDDIIDTREVFSMQILLLDNAIDSLEWSLRHLKTFLETDSHFKSPDTSTTYLKQAILCLNSALELFFKERISAINPLLIYEHISTDDLPQVIIDYYCKVENKVIEEPLYNYIIKNTELHTIDYSKCIELYCSLYSVAQGHKEHFVELNSIRNRLTHLGIHSQEEYYILAGRIADILRYVDYNILREINYLPTTIENICLEIFDIEWTLVNLEEGTWRIANDSRIKEICNYIICLSKCTDIQNYMKEKNVIADFGSTFDADFVYSICTMQKDGIEQEICSIYGSVQNNALFISDSDGNDGPVFAIIPLTELDKKAPKFYISLDDTGTYIPEFQAQSNFWQSKPYSTKFAYVPYGKIKLIETIKKIINYMLL